MSERGTPFDEAALATVTVRVASALAGALGLGTEVEPFVQWPVGRDDAVLAAAVSGDVSGVLLLTVDADVATRLRNAADEWAHAVADASAEMTDVLGVRAVIGAIGAVADGDEPHAIAAVFDAGTVTALVGLSLDAVALATGGAAAFDAPELGGGAVPHEPAAAGTAPTGLLPSHGPLSLLGDVEMIVTAELGRTTMQMRDLLGLAPGMVVEIDRAAGAPIDLLVNGRRLATGEVVVIDEEFGIRITEIVPTEPIR